VVNRPLAALTRAAARLGSGESPDPLPEKGPAEIRAVNRSFNRMVADLAKLEQDRAVLLAGISHDLRTPLTRLRLEVEMNDLPGETREAMIDDLEQMDAIVGQFLAYARPASTAAREPLDIGDLVRDAVQAARVDADATVTVVLDLAPGLQVLGHRTELQRALANLLTNALRYGRDAEGRLALQVNAWRDEGEVVVRVADRGPGVPADDMPRLLRPFERGNAARTEGSGAGLGLSIVQRIAAAHGGSFALSSTSESPPFGLSGEIRLPAVR
jgi:two-component system osmolarity sensor histidine kinase EnvZ